MLAMLANNAHPLTGDLCVDFPGFCAPIEKTASNISSLYQLDAFDWTILIIYFGILTVLAIYGMYRVKQVIEFWRYSKFPPQPKGWFNEAELPLITVQLPLFNEMYVVERLVKAITEIDYPRDRLEIQVLDDSTDETVSIARATVENYARSGFDIHYLHRDDRTGFKAGALEEGMKTAKGELIAIFDADFVPRPDFLRKLVHYFTDQTVGCAQMRWAHINGSYNLLTRLQTILLDEEAPAEIPVEINAFKAQQRRWAKGVLQVWFKLYRRIWYAPLPMRVKLEMFFRLTGNISYPLMIVASFMQFPLLVVRYNQGLHQLMMLDVPLLFFSTISVVLFYGSAIWYLDKKRGRRLWHLPLVMALGIGLAFSNARAVIEALAGVKSDFIRAPKYRVEQTDDESWKRKKYKRKHGWLPLLELSFAFYFVLAIGYAVRMHMWGPIAFLLLFLFGYGYMGVMSLLQTAGGKRLSSALRPASLSPKG